MILINPCFLLFHKGPADSCDSSPCGPGAVCTTNGIGNPICQCEPGLIPKPDTITGCGPECVIDPDCSSGYICENQKCVEKTDTCTVRPRILGDDICDDEANNEACNFDQGDCCLSDEKSLRYCEECECKEPGKDNVGRTRIQDSSDEEPTTGFKDCGKRLSQRDPTGLGQSNGQSVSTLEVILNHIYITRQCLRFSNR